MENETGKTISIQEHERIVSVLYEELKRKDRIIEQLEKENKFIMASAIKEANRNAELAEQIKKIMLKEKKKQA